MKDLSVKAKMTLWYGAFLLVIVAAVAFALVFTTRYIAGQEQKEDLRNAVDASVPEIKIDTEDLEISNSLKNYQDGIYLLIYEDGNFLISGVGPEGYPDNLAFRDKKMRKATFGDSSYYIYDRCLKRKHHVNVWIRGITAADMSVISPSVSTMTKLILIVLPVIVLLAIIGGFRMTRRALRPLGEIADTAHEIGTGRDLSKRIPEKPYSSDKDELRSLVSTFNEMLDRLEKAFIAETQFSDNASHELRTPVSVILAQCEDALETAEDTEDYRKAIDVIFRQAKSMSSLLSQLLTLARADKGTSQLVREKTDLSLLVDLACEELSQQASSKDISIRTHIEDGVFCCGDQTMLTMLFMNLISNTISYGKEGGTTDVSLSFAEPDAQWPSAPAEDTAHAGSLTSDPSEDTAGGGFWTSASEESPKVPEHFLIAEIKDDGIGMAPEHLPKIWDRFYQVDPSRSKDENAAENNTGLGLSMVRWIVSEHQGIITCESAEGKGSVFTVYLPADPAE